MSVDRRLFFGCLTLDSLFDEKSFGYSSTGPFVGCIVGPDGVGKSILALSAASYYAAVPNAGQRRVIYASTDFHYRQAKQTWELFALNHPAKRSQRLCEEIDQFILDRNPVAMLPDFCCDVNVSLKWVSPFSDESNESTIAEVPDQVSSADQIHWPYKHDLSKERNVFFLDLAHFSAGDDWGYLNRMIGLLQDVEVAIADNEMCEGEVSVTSSPPTDDKKKSEASGHLLIVDAVEGLEAMVGERDSFGMIRSRRSRLAQMVRVARRSNCSVLFIVEQKVEHERLDEVFVSDFVVRLRAKMSDDYVSKTIEIEKARAKAHVRGEHEYQIRSGDRHGNSADDPKIRLNLANVDSPLSYVQVFPSLQIKSEIETHSAEFELPETRFPPEIHQLNTLLRCGERKSFDPRDRVLLLVGESRTYKEPLSFAFLADAFRQTHQAGNSQLLSTNTNVPAHSGNAGHIISAICSNFAGALLFTSDGSTIEQINNAFTEWGCHVGPDVNRVGVREIYPSFISSSELLFRLRVGIRKMKKRLGIKNHCDAMHLRVVLDNWTAILESHPSLLRDPQILHRVFRLFQDEGVMAMIVATQPGSPELGLNVTQLHNVLKLEARRIHCWPVNFYGERRVALTTSTANRSGDVANIYELQREGTFRLKLDSEFATFKHLETGKAEPIGLQVKLYSGRSQSGGGQSTAYEQDIAALFGDLYSNSKEHREIVSFESIERYSGFKEYVSNLHGSKLEDTLVFQVDEYWNKSSESLANISSFVGQCEREFLPYPMGNEYRFPLHRDFGMLLLDHDAWMAAAELKIPNWHWMKVSWKGRHIRVPAFGLPTDRYRRIDWYFVTLDEIRSFLRISRQEEIEVFLGPNYDDVESDEEPIRGRGVTVGEVFFSMTNNRVGSQSHVPISWQLFFDTCQQVSKHIGKRAFDIDFRTTETLNCLVLEIWLSRIKQQIIEHIVLKPQETQRSHVDLIKEASDKYELVDLLEFLSNCFSSSSKSTGPLSALLKFKIGWETFLESLSMLAGMLPSKYRVENLVAGTPDRDAIAVRSWYATGVLDQADRAGLVPARLPGSFSVRGDWFLSVAKGSRSLALAERAVRNLTSIAMNFRRFREGVGLPVYKSDDMGLADSAMSTIDSKTLKKRSVTLGELDRIAPHSNFDDAPSPFLSVFRSTFDEYRSEHEEIRRLIVYILRYINPSLNFGEIPKNDAEKFALQRDQVLKSCFEHRGRK